MADSQGVRDDPGSLTEAAFRSGADRRFALDRAHRGDINGALGRIGAHDTAPRRSLRRRALTLLAIMGPGIAVMVADNDAGGVSVYAQAGQTYGLWIGLLVLVLAPVLYVNQEMVARLGAVTGCGHARLVFERFGRRWGWFALSDLLLLNLLTLITEFIGVALALGYFGVNPRISVPAIAVGLIAVTSMGSFRRWERAMYLLVGLSLVAVPLAVLSGWASDRAGSVVATSGPSSAAVGGGMLLFIVAMVGTTVAPWQIFFHQSNVVDKRITSRWIAYEKADLVVGVVLFVVGALAVLVTFAVVIGPGGHPAFSDAGQAASALRSGLGPWAGALFAVVLLNGSILGAAAVSLATSYAIGDVFGARHSLHRPWRQARTFHSSFAAMLVIAAGVVLVPGAPLAVVTVGVQVLAGLLLPSATVFLLLLCNDRAVLGPWVNTRWLNLVALLVVGAMIELSGLVTLTTLFPGIPLREAVVGSTLIVLAVIGGYAASEARTLGPSPWAGTPWERLTWTMPQLELLAPPPRSQGRTTGLVLLRIYLSLVVVLVAVRLLQAIVSG